MGPSFEMCGVATGGAGGPAQDGTLSRLTMGGYISITILSDSLSRLSYMA